MISKTPDTVTHSLAEYKKIASEHYIWPLLSREEIESDFALILAEGSGVRVRDVGGQEFIDLVSTGSRASNLGYADKRMVEAIADQMLRLQYGGTGPLQSAITLDLALRLGELAPGDLTATVFSGSGSEANEVALKLARLYHRSRGNERKYKVISRWDDFHGSIGSAQEASDWLGVRKPAEPGVPGFSRVPAPHAYRCPFGLEPEAWGRQCADYLAMHIEHEGPELISAVLIEPIGQANGAQVPPPGYLERVRKICSEYDVLLIADEIITGFGRTGKWFAVEHWGVEPDIMTVGKAITAGFLPLAATIASADVRDAVSVFPDVHTFGGHASACMAALAAIERYQSEDLIGRAEELGGRLMTLLGSFEDLHVVGQVRGLGLWAAVDFTRDPSSRAVLPPDVIREIVMRARARGVLVSQNGSAIELAPPLVISEEDLEHGVAQFRTAITEVCGD